MQRILHIQSSPRSNSFSTSAAERFLSDVSSATPTLEIDRLNLWNVDLPSLDGEAISAKYARLAGQSFTPGHVSAWAKIEEVVARIDRAVAYINERAAG